MRQDQHVATRFVTTACTVLTDRVHYHGVYDVSADHIIRSTQQQVKCICMYRCVFVCVCLLAPGLNASSTDRESSTSIL
jgi:hypothetical protein